MGKSIMRTCPLCGQNFSNMNSHWDECHRDINRREFYKLVGPSYKMSSHEIHSKVCHICGEEVTSLKIHWRKSHSDIDYWDYIWGYMGRPVCQVCGKELKGPQYGHHPYRRTPRSCCSAHENTLRYREGTLNSDTAFGGDSGRRKGIETSKQRDVLFGGPQKIKENAGKGGRAAAAMGVAFGGPDRTNAKKAKAEAQSNPDYPVRVYIGKFLDLRSNKVYTKVGISHDISQRIYTLWCLDYRPKELIVTDFIKRSEAREIERSIHEDSGFLKFKMDSRRREGGIGSNGSREWYLESEFDKIKDYVYNFYSKEFSEWPLEK